MMASKTPSRPSPHLRRPANPTILRELLRELDLLPTGLPSFVLVSRWAAKHVWRVNVNGHPWAYIRYLLGPSEAFPDRWRHMKLSLDLYQAEVGPPVLGLTPASQALNGRAAMVEKALTPITREELTERAEEAIELITQLQTSSVLNEALAAEPTVFDEEGFTPRAVLLRETRERWFEAVTERWLEAGLDEITGATAVVSDLMARLEKLHEALPRLDIVVPTHNDLNSGNFMLNQGGALRLIDFETLSLNNPIADLGVFLAWHVPSERRRDILRNYPLAEPETVLRHMQVWVPLRYLNIAAHWAARLTRSTYRAVWDEAAEKVREWLWDACEEVYGGTVPRGTAQVLNRLENGLKQKNRRFKAGLPN